MNKIYGVILGAVIGFAVVACGGSSGGAIADGTDTYSKTEVDAMIADLQAQIDALKTSVKPRDTLYSPNGSSTGMAKTASASGAATWTDIGTRLECLPTNEFFGDWCRILSPNGYYFALQLGRGDTYPMQAGRIYFEQAGCTGAPHMHPFDVAPDSDVQGFVTGVYPPGSIAPTDILMFEAGSTLDQNVTMLSFIEEPFTPCQSYTGGPDSFLRLVPNDPAVSGVNNTNYGQLSLQP